MTNKSMSKGWWILLAGCILIIWLLFQPEQNEDDFNSKSNGVVDESPKVSSEHKEPITVPPYTSSRKKTNELYYLKENCLAATTESKLSRAIYLATVGNLENLEDFMVENYPRTMVLKPGYKVKLIKYNSKGDYARVDPLDGGPSYWVEAEMLK